MSRNLWEKNGDRKYPYTIRRRIQPRGLYSHLRYVCLKVPAVLKVLVEDMQTITRVELRAAVDDLLQREAFRSALNVGMKSRLDAQANAKHVVTAEKFAAQLRDLQLLDGDDVGSSNSTGRSEDSSPIAIMSLRNLKLFRFQINPTASTRSSKARRL